MAPVRYFDLTKEDRPRKAKMNGHKLNAQHGNLDPFSGQKQAAPEDVARAALQKDHMADYEAFMRQRNGIPIPQPEPPKRELTDRQKHWVRLLLDPRWQPRQR